MLRASYGIYYGRQNMLSQVGSITDNGVQQFGIACASSFGCSNGGRRDPTWPNIVPVPPGVEFHFGASVRVFSKDYANPRIYTTNVGSSRRSCRTCRCISTSHTRRPFI